MGKITINTTPIITDLVTADLAVYNPRTGITTVYPTTIYGIAIDDFKSGDHGIAIFISMEIETSPAILAVDSAIVRPILRLNYYRFSGKIDIFIPSSGVNPICDRHRIPIHRCIYPRLDGGVLGWDEESVSLCEYRQKRKRCQI
jgi:hypothetical protein